MVRIEARSRPLLQPSAQELGRENHADERQECATQ